MTIQIEAWHILSAVFALIGGYFALVKVIVWQFNKSLDVRFEAQEEIRKAAQSTWSEKFAGLQSNHDSLLTRFNNHLQTELPAKLGELQRREDAIRQEVMVVNRLDGLADLFREGLRDVDNKIESIRRSRHA